VAAPVRRDDVVELDVESLAFGGNGVARLNGYVVFVRRDGTSTNETYQFVMGTGPDDRTVMQDYRKL